MIDRDRFSDEYDPEPDYGRPTRAEAEADMADDNFELYCDYCERTGHTFRTCPARDDEPQEEWPDFGIGPLCEEDPENEGHCTYHKEAHGR